MSKRISIFVDGANVFYAQRDNHFLIDWEKMLAHFSQIGELYETFYYIGEHIPPEARTEKYLKLLRHIGFIVRTKRIKTIIQDDGTKKQKANLDIEIAMDLFNTIENYNVAVLFSGDGDFERAIELVRARGKEIYVVSTDNYIASELRNAAGRNYINFTKMTSWKRREWKDIPPNPRI
ncbi:MAG: NYN domain-containing protein [Chitinispirillaceae bacterium]|nr:NYN domain-containing protein [Chitinispirillaceae bacterium]